MKVRDQRFGSKPHRADQALGARSRSATRAFPPEGDDGDSGEGPIGQSRGNVAMDRVSLAPEVFLRTT